MNTSLPSRAAPSPLPPGEGRGEGAPAAARRGFTLVELLVTITIIVILVALFGGAISAARVEAQIFTTSGVVARLDQIISTQFRRYEARRVSGNDLRDLQRNLGVSGSNPSAARAWHIRRNMITADMPDRWSDVAYMASAAGIAEGFPKTAAQACYVATWKALPNDTKRLLPGDSGYPTNDPFKMLDAERTQWGKDIVCFAYGGAECLFMIIMQGGFADCLDCNGLANAKKGDKDGDGMLEFWDAWDNPIDYILWAPSFQTSGDRTTFFSSLDNPFPATGSVRPGLGMRPLIYSAGPDGSVRPDGRYALCRIPVIIPDTTIRPPLPAMPWPVTADLSGEKAPNLTAGSGPTGRDCGNPVLATGSASIMGGPVNYGRAENALRPALDEYRLDNIVNVGLKAKQ